MQSTPKQPTVVGQISLITRLSKTREYRSHIRIDTDNHTVIFLATASMDTSAQSEVSDGEWLFSSSHHLSASTSIF